MYMFDLEKYRPKAENLPKPELPKAVLDKWTPEIHAVEASDESTINIYSYIGDYGEAGDMTTRIVSAILNKNNGKDVTVNINSPGGSFFEGLAIYTLLKEYKGKVNIRVVSLAGSAASIIAMAGDNIEIAEAGFFMIHNSWSLAIGNQHDMLEASEMLAKFDESMNEIYSKVTGLPSDEIQSIMDKETWLSGKDAVEMGFAKDYLSSDKIKKDTKDEVTALRRIDVALAKDGVPRSERRALIKELTGKQDAASQDAKPCASTDINEALNALLAKINKQ